MPFAVGFGVGLENCAGSFSTLGQLRLGADAGAVGIVGSCPVTNDGCGGGGGMGSFAAVEPTEPQRIFGLLSLLFAASSNGVERSGMRSPEISQIM